MYRLAGRRRLRDMRKAWPSTASCSAAPRRGLAVPVNKQSSVDPLLGIAPPPAPRAQQERSVDGSPNETEALPNFLAGTSRPNNPNDLTDLLRGNKLPGFRRNGNENAQSRSRTAAAIGAMRRGSGSTIPTQDLEDAFLPPHAPEPSQVQSSAVQVDVDPTPVDREHPHPIDAIYGRNDLDERILAAARALHHARTNDASPLSRASTIPGLLDDFHRRSEKTLSVELPNESQPKEGRRVPMTSAASSEAELNEKFEDGVLLVAYVTGLQGGRGQERICVCSGFAVEGGDRLGEDESKSKGPLVVSCAHTVSCRHPHDPWHPLMQCLAPSASRISSDKAQECASGSRGQLIGCSGHHPVWTHLSHIVSRL